jgi:hypothetical protein
MGNLENPILFFLLFILKQMEKSIAKIKTQILAKVYT